MWAQVICEWKCIKASKQLQNRTHVASCLVADKRAVLDNQRAVTKVNGAALKQFDFPPHQLEDSSWSVIYLWGEKLQNSSVQSAHICLVLGTCCLVADKRAVEDLQINILVSINSSSLQGGCPTAPQFEDSSPNVILSLTARIIKAHLALGTFVAVKSAIVDSQSAVINVNGSSLYIKRFEFPPHHMQEMSWAFSCQTREKNKRKMLKLCSPRLLCCSQTWNHKSWVWQNQLKGSKGHRHLLQWRLPTSWVCHRRT